MEIKGQKDLVGKVSFAEIPPQFILDLAYQLNKNKTSHGGKYEPFNWQGSDPNDILDALERHLIDIKSYIQNDKPIISPEPLRDHIMAAVANLMILHHVKS